MGRLWGAGKYNTGDWSRAHTELPHMPQADRRKFGVAEHPLAHEWKLKEMVPLPRAEQRQVEQFEKQYESELRDKAAVKAGEALAFGGRRAKDRLDSFRRKTQEVFIHDFKNWLAGVGYSQDYVRGGIPLKHVGQGRPVSTHPSVISYLDRSTSRVVEYEKQLQLLKLRMGRSTPGKPPSVEDCWRYFKYIVRGEPYDPADWPSVEDAADGKHQPVVNPNKRAAIDGPREFIPSDEQLALSFGEKRRRKAIDEGWEGRKHADGRELGCDQTQEKDDAKVAGAEADLNAEENSDDSSSSKEDAEAADDMLDGEVKKEEVEGPDEDEAKPAAPPSAEQAKQMAEEKAAKEAADKAAKEAAEKAAKEAAEKAAKEAAKTTNVFGGLGSKAAGPAWGVAAVQAASAISAAADKIADTLGSITNDSSSSNAPPAVAAPPPAVPPAVAPPSNVPVFQPGGAVTPPAVAPPSPEASQHASPASAPATPANERLMNVVEMVGQLREKGDKITLRQAIDATAKDEQSKKELHKDLDAVKEAVRDDPQLRQMLEQAGEVFLAYAILFILLIFNTDAVQTQQQQPDAPQRADNEPDRTSGRSGAVPAAVTGTAAAARSETEAAVREGGAEAQVAAQKEGGLRRLRERLSVPSHYGALDAEPPERVLEGTSLPPDYGVLGPVPELPSPVSLAPPTFNDAGYVEYNAPADYSALALPMEAEATAEVAGSYEGPGQLEESAAERQARRARQMPMLVQQARDSMRAELRQKLLKAKQREALVAAAAANARAQSQRPVIAEKQPEVAPQLQPQEFVGPSRTTEHGAQIDADRLVAQVYGPHAAQRTDSDPLEPRNVAAAQEQLQRLPAEAQAKVAQRFNEFAQTAQATRDKRKRLADLMELHVSQRRAQHRRKLLERLAGKQRALNEAGQQRREAAAKANEELEQQAARRNLIELQQKLDEEDAEAKEARTLAYYSAVQKYKGKARERVDAAQRTGEALSRLQAERAAQSEVLSKAAEATRRRDQETRQREAAAIQNEVDVAASFRSRLETQRQAGEPAPAAHPAYSTSDPEADAAYARGVQEARRQQLAAPRESHAPNPVPQLERLSRLGEQIAALQQQRAGSQQQRQTQQLRDARSRLAHGFAIRPAASTATATAAPSVQPASRLTIQRRPLPPEQHVQVSIPNQHRKKTRR